MDADAKIRTASAIPVETIIFDCSELPVYLRIADKATHLRKLGMRDRATARVLCISDKTAANASR